MNHTDQGRFVGLLCAPCHSFISGGDGGVYSQVSRNTKREWIGLTVEDIEELRHLKANVNDFTLAAILYEAESILKEKNT